MEGKRGFLEMWYCVLGDEGGNGGVFYGLCGSSGVFWGGGSGWKIWTYSGLKPEISVVSHLLCIFLMDFRGIAVLLLRRLEGEEREIIEL